MPFLVLSDVVESVEDIHAVLEGVFFPFAGVANDAAPGDRADLLAKAEKSVDGCLEATAAVPAEDEFVAVDVDVLLPKAVVCPHRPALEVGEDAMNPLEDDMGWHCILGA